VLHYPFLDPRGDFPSYELGAASGFDPREAEWYWQQYAAGPADLTDPDLAPLLSDRLVGLPPLLVTTAEHDPLRDEGEHLAALVAEAGGQVTCTRYLGQIHGYWRHAAFPASEQAILQTCAFVRSH
jgi:acetyl esterase